MSAQPDILIHYLRLACKEAGANWKGENETELGMIADEIRAIARDELADLIDDLRDRVSALENR
ncbi:hypothetical protein [Nonomuraea guangzhouensis]|uniref:Uncharacterized protein n=1 Tax=Nonomuraea guangzhouensis TaxID=1291555 RepID=A0ABW4H060_9ACTN|nr:hypothetical protein [Nonomuraea guangzhouensis]